ncbi:DegT/DnrJ/EryC1/StrS family aminotransferase [Acaryochloris marina]|uniref:DegT/DnrJ/EryC1/StrS aminotransferase family protein n=1 Tax=Acaryochloris marina (strain MBIC 11017) TaxID=329726 RepID=B0BZG3_ACAM1|nr:DegT/DnrJ/EryC1/StrS family aminotransferase [Acaryochloris marina]ABW30708.1 DegT/DnrJ/EryC1/StrS aminotransferase family protein [Acaryochloris marina MBIC11017]BDM79488.1 perosamine synthetase [Acaryochloris marina MBIC10699]
MTEHRNIPISLPSTGEEEWLALKEPLLSGWLTQGPKVAAFEADFAKRHGVKHAVATTSCTTSLHLILTALDIGPGDEVIVPAFTWVSTANVVLYCGATPIFADVDPKTYNLAIDQVANKITERTKAILPVHLFGRCADMDALAELAPNIPLVEDAACAAGAAYKGRAAGSLGIAGAFSFHPRKSITTGEGGMVTTNDDALADRMRIIRNHGASISEEQRHLGPKPYILPEFNLLGFNYRMTDLQGAVGLVQLQKLDGLLEERRQWAEYYSRELASIKWLRTPQVTEEYSHGWQAYVCFVDETVAPRPRNSMMEFLQSKGVSTRPGTHAVHLLGYYKDRFGLAPEDFPGARDCDRFTLALPLHNQMTASDYRYVVAALKELE